MLFFYPHFLGKSRKEDKPQKKTQVPHFFGRIVLPNPDKFPENPKARSSLARESHRGPKKTRLINGKERRRDLCSPDDRPLEKKPVVSDRIPCSGPPPPDLFPEREEPLCRGSIPECEGNGLNAAFRDFGKRSEDEQGGQVQEQDEHQPAFCPDLKGHPPAGQDRRPGPGQGEGGKKKRVSQEGGW